MGEKDSDGESDAEVKHESYHDCPLPATAEQGEKILCECGRLWRYDNGYFIVEGKDGVRGTIEPSDKDASAGYRPPSDDVICGPTIPYDNNSLERRVCPNCRGFFDTSEDSDSVFCGYSCSWRHERGIYL